MEKNRKASYRKFKLKRSLYYSVFNSILGAVIKRVPTTDLGYPGKATHKGQFE
jgi:hypothetical protein